MEGLQATHSAHKQNVAPNLSRLRAESLFVCAHSSVFDYPTYLLCHNRLQNADAAQPARSALQPDMSVVHCDFSIPPQSPINSLGLKYSVGGAGSPWMQFYSNTCPTGKKATPIMHSKQSAATSKPVTGGSHRGGVSGSAARVRHG